jgi:RelB Antitoxin
MEITKSYITDETGAIKSVVIDLQTFKKIEELILDYALGKGMNEVADDVEYDLEEAKIALRENES